MIENWIRKTNIRFGLNNRHVLPFIFLAFFAQIAQGKIILLPHACTPTHGGTVSCNLSFLLRCACHFLKLVFLVKSQAHNTWKKTSTYTQRGKTQTTIKSENFHYNCELMYIPFCCLRWFLVLLLVGAIQAYGFCMLFNLLTAL